MKIIALILMGCGGVGLELIHHIVSCRSLHANKGVRLRIVGVCDSKSLLVASDVYTTELDDALLLEVCRVKSHGSSLVTLSSSGYTPYRLHAIQDTERNSYVQCKCDHGVKNVKSSQSNFIYKKNEDKVQKKK